MKLYIFNPENDMALASASPGYTPPANIKEYRRVHWELPRLWAREDDVVWDGESSLKPLFEGVAEVPEICPWGWSPALAHELELAGVPKEFLPSREYLSQLRMLSSRESTVPVQQALGIDAMVCNSLEDVEQCVARWGEVVMKSPWSSSGKGLMMLDNPNWSNWVARILRLQGSVIVERMMDKRQDFAMEFWMSAGVARYVGLNVFATDAHGHFLENEEALQEDKWNMIARMLANEEQLTTIRQYFETRLAEMAPWYEGPVGVDMMVLANGELHPCIEINWRMTMGMVEVMRRGALNVYRNTHKKTENP